MKRVQKCEFNCDEVVTSLIVYNIEMDRDDKSCTVLTMDRDDNSCTVLTMDRDENSCTVLTMDSVNNRVHNLNKLFVKMFMNRVSGDVKLVVLSGNVSTIREYSIKNINIKYAVFILHNAWTDTNTSVIKKSWKELYNCNKDVEIPDDDDIIPLTELINQLNRVHNNVELISTVDIIQSLNNPHEEVKYDLIQILK